MISSMPGDATKEQRLITLDTLVSSVWGSRASSKEQPSDQDQQDPRASLLFAATSRYSRKYHTVDPSQFNSSSTRASSGSGSRDSSPLPFPDGAQFQLFRVKNSFIDLPTHEEEQSQQRLRRCSSAPELATAKAEEPEDEISNEQEEQEKPISKEEIVELKKEMWKAHDAGDCKPCLYFTFKADSCRKGDDCVFCHRCTRGEIMESRKQQKKARRIAEAQAEAEATGRSRTVRVRPRRSHAKRAAAGMDCPSSALPAPTGPVVPGALQNPISGCVLPIGPVPVGLTPAHSPAAMPTASPEHANAQGYRMVKTPAGMVMVQLGAVNLR